MRIIFYIFAYATLLLNASAAETEWTEIAPDTRARMIFSDVLGPDNTTMVALELDMPANTKTYWRVPGETGIPLMIDTAASSGLQEPEIIWPFPESAISYGFVDRVFHGSFILPMQILVTGQEARLDYDFVLGVCSDICVPVTVNFAHNLSFEKRDSGAALQIAQTMANTPISWGQGAAPFGDIMFDQTTQQLHVTVKNTDIETVDIIVTFGESYEVFSMPQKSQSEDTLIFTRLGRSNNMDWLDQNVTLTFMSPDGPYELSLPVEIR